MTIYETMKVTSTSAVSAVLPNIVWYKLSRNDNGFLLPQGEGQDEGKKWCSLLHPLTLTLSRRERE
jgi:hypothetical protein